ncbi:MAG TPA: hypothetical protein VM557_04580 [Thermoanaerobaculia bacterium]|nr:hypothetical protein [Thermoanaerobaculia bacterium]
MKNPAGGAPEIRGDAKAECRLLFRASARLYLMWRAFHPEVPHYKPGAVRAIERYITPSASVFEWGSGVSTLWYGTRAGRVVAIEHDRMWWEWVNERLRQRELSTVECRFSPPLSESEAEVSEWSRKLLELETPGSSPRRREFLRYIAEIDPYPDEDFDLIVVDGRERVGCILHARPKLKQDGWLVLDDSHRSRYDEAVDLLHGWESRRFSFGLMETTIFRKP